jgi:hypothetical protein
MDPLSAKFAKAFLKCAASIRDIKRVYRALALQHHPDKGGDKEQFQKLENVYAIAKKGRAGMTELRRTLPKKLRLKAAASTPHADKLGVFVRDAETINKKPLYVNEADDPKTAIWWAPPDRGYPTGMWLVGRYDKRGQDVAYHIRAARWPSLEAEKTGAWETFSPTSERFEKTEIDITIIEA